MVENITLQVEGMMCIGCEQRLGKALGRLEEGDSVRGGADNK